MLLFRAQFDSTSTWFIREYLYNNIIWLLGCLQLFLCHYVASLFGMITNFVSRFLVGGEGKEEKFCKIDGFREELTNFLFHSHEDVLEDFGIGEEKNQRSSFFVDTISNVDREKEKNKEIEAECSVSKKGCSDDHEEENNMERETNCCVSLKVHSDSHEIKEKITKIESLVSEVHVEGKVTSILENKEEAKFESSISMVVHCDLEEIKKEGETEKIFSMGNHSTLMEGQSHDDIEGGQICSLMEENSTTTSQKYQYVTGKDISGFMEEPTCMRFTFQEFFVGPNVPVVFNDNGESMSKKQEISDHLKEEEDGEGESAQENEFLGCSNSLKKVESEYVMDEREERSEEYEEERSNQEQEINKHREKAQEWKKMLEELESEVGNEWRMEWEHDDIVDQLKVELRNARQGGLSTIIEEEEEEQEEEEEDDEEELEEEREEETGETEYAEGVGDQKLQNNEESQELNDQMDEIEEVYQIYEDKMRKLDILNYQTMHGLGLLQLKDSSKTNFKGLKPLISQNLRPRKETKTPLMKLVQELQRDLEVVYVGQVCLSWEILCWLHRKALQLKQQYDSLHHHHHHPHFNVAAGEFQLFQVLLQRFIENEAFQGPRTLNFVKNRCVIRNLLQVPAIRDDSAREKNITKGDDEEYMVTITRLAEIIKESMWLFWKFVRADKEDGNLILRVSQQTRTDTKDPTISDLVKDIRAHLHKKDKKLKDLVRTGNCIVRKFQKHYQQQEEQLNHEQLLAQVELKLVSRVLNLSKLRKEHLIWCNEKLRRIKFVMKKKKVVVEPSFLLFPC